VKDRTSLSPPGVTGDNHPSVTSYDVDALGYALSCIAEFNNDVLFAFDEAKHLRAPRGAKGKYKGGQFTPKSTPSGSKVAKGKRVKASAKRKSSKKPSAGAQIWDRRRELQGDVIRPDVTASKKIFSTIVDSMPKKLHRHLDAAISGGVMLYSGIRTLSDRMLGSGRLIVGMYLREAMMIHLPADMSFAGMGDITGAGGNVSDSSKQYHVYTHEIGHAIDHAIGKSMNVKRASHSKEWKDAYEKEINIEIETERRDGRKQKYPPLTRYSRASVEEGFAEFFRAVYTSHQNPERRKAMEERFPKCMAFFRTKGLLPEAA
jgi:hypothetical protein